MRPTSPRRAALGRRPYRYGGVRPAWLVAVTLMGGTTLEAAAGAEARSWDFESKPTGWALPGAAGQVVAEPGKADNGVVKIVATRPHHTRMMLTESRGKPDFEATCRVRVLRWQGHPPTIYVYARSDRGGFRGLSLSGDRARLFCWRGRGKRNPTLGQEELREPIQNGGWWRVRLVCFGDHVAARVWPEGAPEPPHWPLVGHEPDQPAGQFGIGLWLAPKTTSRAEAAVDDVTFRPLVEEDLAGLRLRVQPRAALEDRVVRDQEGAFREGSLAGLATPTTLIAFDPDHGEVAHLVDRATGREFVAAAPARPLFRLRLTKPAEGLSRRVAAAEFRKITCEVVNDREFLLRFSDHFSMPLEAEIRARENGDGLIRLGLEVRNGTDWAVAVARFPQMAWPARLGKTSKDDRLLLPFYGGSILPEPASRRQSRSAHYPGLSFAQFTALYDDTAGLYLASYDPDGHCKRWDLSTGEDAFVQMPLAHLMPEVPGRDARLPYDVVITTFRGDWRDAAAIYKRWAVRQPWCVTKLRERDDIPAFVKSGAGVIITGIQNEHGRTKRFGARLERLPEWIAQYREKTGLNCVVFVPYGWENRGTWAGINYLPAVPSNAAWKKVNAALHKQGDRTAFLTSGYWWVIKRRRTGSGPAFDDSEDFERRGDMVARRPDGIPYLVDNYDRVRDHGNWRGLSATLCHGSEDATDAMKRIFLDVARLGTPLISFDQEIGGEQRYPCYAEDHGHPPGYGRWMWTGLRDCCKAILAEGKAIEPELGLFLENTSELAIPYMATYWSRQFSEVDCPVTGSRGIGLFSYLYHEYVTAIGAACVQGQGARTTRPSAELRCRIYANNLVRGLIPGPFAHHVPLEGGDAWTRTTAAAYFSYCRIYASFPEYLVLGEACRPPDVACQEVDAWFYRYDGAGTRLREGGPKVSKVTLPLEAVVVGSFKAADGTVGTVIANTTDRPQRATLTLRSAAREAKLYRADRSSERTWHDVPAGQPVSIALEPFGTRMLVVGG